MKVSFDLYIPSPNNPSHPITWNSATICLSHYQSQNIFFFFFVRVSLSLSHPKTRAFTNNKRWPNCKRVIKKVNLKFAKKLPHKYIWIGIFLNFKFLMLFCKKDLNWDWNNGNLENPNNMRLTTETTHLHKKKRKQRNVQLDNLEDGNKTLEFHAKSHRFSKAEIRTMDK